MWEWLDGSDSYAYRSYERGEIVKGRIVRIGPGEVLIDIGAKAEGVLSPREIEHNGAWLNGLSEGDEIDVKVLDTEDRDGNIVVSMVEAQLDQEWDVVEERFTRNEIFQEPVIGHNKGGLIVNLGQVRGFVPSSQVDASHGIDRSGIDGTDASPLSEMVGKTLWLKIIELDRAKNRLVLSEQAAVRDRRKDHKASLLEQIQEGHVLQGRVTSLAEFGAFVDIGGADGLVHLSELAWARVSHPSEVVSLGQVVDVQVISVDRERNRIGLSLKRLQPEPWRDIEQHIKVGDLTEGVITRLTQYGAFARVDGAVEGLIHLTELSDEPLEDPGQVVEPGQRVVLRVIRLQPERKRLGLSLKRVESDSGTYDDAVTDYPADDEGSEVQAAALPGEE
jgi:small subunit ribosomal protein S1